MQSQKARRVAAMSDTMATITLRTNSALKTSRTLNITSPVLNFCFEWQLHSTRHIRPSILHLQAAPSKVNLLFDRLQQTNLRLKRTTHRRSPRPNQRFGCSCRGWRVAFHPHWGGVSIDVSLQCGQKLNMNDRAPATSHVESEVMPCPWHRPQSGLQSISRPTP